MVEPDTTGGDGGPRRVPKRLRERIPELLVEAFSVMLAVLVALAVDAWREDRSNRELAQRAQASIVEEIETNRTELVGAADSNDELLGRLGRYLDEGDEEALSGFDFSFSLLTSAAWQTAQMTRAAHFLDFDWVARIARLYDLQELYDRAQSAVVDEFGSGGPDEDQLQEFLRRLRARISLAATLQDGLLQAYEEALTASGSGAGESGSGPELPAELEAQLQGKTVFLDGTLLRHASLDAAQAVEIASLLEIGRQRIETFFGEPFPEPFTVTLAPDRDSFSAVLRAEWGVPETACWMVATGVADFMVILSPRVWGEQACEHDPSDRQHVQDIVTHELAHVFHGQRNPTRDFSGAEEIGWYAEGLAVLVADQLNRDRLSDPAQAVASGAAPTLLADAWSGEYRYGVSGSIAAYIDDRYGRQTTLQLLAVTTQAEFLSLLNVTEETLLAAWKSWLTDSAED